MIATALIASVGATPLGAQDMVPHPSFGLLGGVDFAKIKGANDQNSKSRTGIVGGLSLTFHLPSHFFVEGDALYSQEGASETQQGANDLILKLDYLRVPVQLGYRFPTHSPVHPFVSVGPSFGLKLNCKETVGSQSASCSAESVDVKKVDFAGVASAGVGFRVGAQELSLQGRYTHGFTNINANSNSGGAKNENWAVLAGISF